jgi:hypothetical protein
MTKPLLVTLCLLGVSAGISTAQESPSKKALRIEFKDVKLESQPTPQIEARNIVDKRWKPKTWLEVDVDFEIKLPTTEGREATYPALTVNYFMVLNATTKSGNHPMLKGSVTYSNVPGHEKVHALAFISPATLKAALRKENGNKGDVMAYYVEIVGGEEKAFKSNGPGANKWWEDPEKSKLEVIDGAILGKDKTPFAPFWGDYDLTPQSK